MADELVNEQIAYYDARADEYDRMLARERRYELDGLSLTAPDRDTRELAAAEATFDAEPLSGDVLEIACGTGWWTNRLLRTASSVTALDASSRMLDLHRRRVTSPAVTRVHADIFTWEPDRLYDRVFFGFWLSHVPPDLFAPFWAKLARSLEPGGLVFWVDEFEWDFRDQHEVSVGDGRGTTLRHIEDGREFRMVKVYYRPAELARRLGELGWRADVRYAGSRIYSGRAARPGGPAIGAA